MKPVDGMDYLSVSHKSGRTLKRSINFPKELFEAVFDRSILTKQQTSFPQQPYHITVLIWYNWPHYKFFFYLDAPPYFYVILSWRNLPCRYHEKYNPKGKRKCDSHFNVDSIAINLFFCVFYLKSDKKINCHLNTKSV